jgi:hypothetical protein
MIVDLVLKSSIALVSAPGWRSSTIELPSGMMILVHTSNTRLWPKTTKLSYWPISYAPCGWRMALESPSHLGSLRPVGGIEFLLLEPEVKAECCSLIIKAHGGSTKALRLIVKCQRAFPNQAVDTDAKLIVRAIPTAVVRNPRWKHSRR